MQFPCNPLIEDYTEIYYMIDEGDIPSIQCTMSRKGAYMCEKRRWPESYLHWFLCSSAHTTYQYDWDLAAAFWEHNTLCGLSYIYRCHQQRDSNRHQTPVVSEVSFINTLYNEGNRTEPCGTPACISLGVYISPSAWTLNFLWERKEIISLLRRIDNFNSNN
jgi:hypothetical protein